MSPIHRGEENSLLLSGPTGSGAAETWGVGPSMIDIEESNMGILETAIYVSDWSQENGMT